MDAGGPKGKAKSDINVTPLIDIVLVLLIVFIVMVPGLTKAAKVVVPQVTTVQQPTPPSSTDTPIVVSIDRDNKVSLQNSEVTDMLKLVDDIATAAKKQPINNRKVFFKVDEDVTYQTAVNILDQIRVASDRAKAETLKDPTFQGLDGGDIKIAISIKKRA